MNAKILVIITILLVSSVSAAAEQEEESWFQKMVNKIKEFFSDEELEEAPFNLISKNEDYDVREYLPRKWACVEANETMNSDTFWKLYGYIDGKNDRNQKMEMTIPVSMESDIKGGSLQKMSSCFYIGQEYQDNPPVPDNQEVKIVGRKSKIVYAMKFGGYAWSEKDWMEKTDELKNILKEAGEEMKTDVVYWNGFDSPMHFWNRRNEIWIIKDNSV